jgi:sigma-B regulation protein RsbU (phosphoserine phosphatase)
MVCELNRILVDNLDSKTFITLVLACLESDGRCLRLARAGHCHPLHLKPDGRLSELRSKGVGLGLVGAERFDELLEEVELELEPGDSLVLYTDGLTDAADASGRMYGEQRLRELLCSNSGLTAQEQRDAVMRSIREFASGGELQDDVTLIVARSLPEPRQV